MRVAWVFRYRSNDRVEFEPDAVALQQPAIELEYARSSPSETAACTARETDACAPR